MWWYPYWYLVPGRKTWNVLWVDPDTVRTPRQAGGEAWAAGWFRADRGRAPDACAGRAERWDVRAEIPETKTRRPLA